MARGTATLGKGSKNRNCKHTAIIDPVARAARFTVERLEARTLLAVTLTPQHDWVEEGPKGLIELRTGDTASGAMQALAVSTALPNLAYAGAANGGIWKTTNLLAAIPDWTPLTDFMPTLSVGAIALSPLDSSGATVFAGAGAFSSFARHAGLLIGMMRTTDGGTHWEAFMGSNESGPVFLRNELSIHTVLPTATDDAGNPTTDINSQVVLVAASQETIDAQHPDGGGIFRSTDGGRTVERVLAGSATDIIADPTDPKRFYAAVVRGPAAGIGLYQSVDGGKKWDLKNGGLVAGDFTKLVRIDLEASPAAGNPIYAAIIRSLAGKDQLSAVARLNTPTGNWVKSANVPNVTSGGQGSVHFSMIPDPANADILYMGGDRHPDSRLGDIQLFNATTGISETLVRGGANDTSPHADSRDIQFVIDGSGKKYLIEADDGGVYRYLLEDPTALIDPKLRTWVDLNANLAVTEMVQIAYDTINKMIYSGNIDNGTTVQQPGTSTWREAYGGDGFSQAFATEAGGGATWYSIQNSLVTFVRATIDAAGNRGAPQFIALAKPGQAVTPGDVFPANHQSALHAKDKGSKVKYNKLAVNAVDPKRLIVGHFGLYESDDGKGQGDRGDHVIPIHIPATNNEDKERLRALAYGHTGNTAIIYAGRHNVLSVSEAFGTPGKPRTFKHFKVEVKANGKVIKSADRIRGIAIDPDDWRTVYVASTSDIFRSTDAGQTWSFVSEPGGKQADLISLVVLKQGATPQSRVLIVGSGSGVFFAREASGTIAGDWLRLGNKLPRAVVTDLQYVPGEDKLVAGTLGRGAWSLENLTAALTGPVLTVTGTGADDNIVISRSDDNPEMITVTTNGANEGTWDRRYLAQISVLGGDGNDVIHLVADDGGLVASDGNGSFLPTGNVTVNGGTAAGDTNNQVIITGPGLTVPFAGGNRIVTTDGQLLTVTLSSNTTLVNNVPTLEQKLGSVRAGLQQLLDWSGDIRNTVQGKVGGLADGLGDMLDGARHKKEQLLETSPEVVRKNEKQAMANELSGAFERAGTKFLRRIFEQGVGSFDLSAIGAHGGIGSLEALRDRLLALDEDPTTTVTLTVDANGNPIYDFSVIKRLDGGAPFEVEALDGLISVGGIANLEADVRVHLRFGIDANGFFIAPEQNAEPEIIVSNISGRIEGEGRIGFIGVELADGTFALDPDVKLSINLHDPGTDAEDGMIRLSELTGLSNELLTVSLKGDAADGLNDDIVFQGDFTVAALGFQLPELTLGLRWADAEQIAAVQIDPGPTLNALLGVDVTNFVDTVLGAAEQVQQMTGVDVFAQKIPLLEKSVNDMLGGTAVEAFVDADITDLSAVFQEDGFNKFQVLLNNIDAAARGIIAGNQVTFVDTNGAVQPGVVDSVGGGGFIVRFDLSNSATPREDATESVKVTRQASIRDQINAALKDLTNPIGLAGRIPTIQDLGDALGVDLSKVKLSDAGDAIEIPFAFKLDPIHFAHKLDLGGRIAGINLSAAGNIDVEISPSFAFTAGVRFGAAVPLAERIYLKENADAEVTLGVKVTLDDPTASGSIGFLNVALSEDTPNNGISFLGTLKLNLTDPGVGAGDDGRILLSELTPGNLLSSFDADIAADLVINPIKIVATIGNATELGKITIKLDAADGHIASLADLTALPGKIQIAGNTAFENFNNITPQMIIDAIQALIEKLRALGGGGVLDTKLPVLDKSLSELVDLGEKFATDIGLLDPSGAVNVEKFEQFLESKLGPIDVTIKSDAIQFTFTFDEDLNESLPISLNLGDSFGLLSVEGGGVVNFTGSADANITFGLLTGANIPIARRLFFDTDGPDASKIEFSGSANLGYGGGSDPGFDALVKLGFLEFGVQDARALIELTQLLGELKDPGNAAGEGAGRLTFQEIADKIAAQQFTQILDGSYTGRVQARIPLDGPDAGNTVPFPIVGSDALIEVAGKLENLGNIVFADPGLHTDSSTPLDAADLHPTELQIFQHNIDNLIANAVLDFDNLIAGLEKLIEWGDKMLGLGVLDFELPFTGAKIRDAINFFKDPDGPIQKILAAIPNAALGNNPTDALAKVAAQQIENALAGISGLGPIVAGGDILAFQHQDNDPAKPLLGATFKFKYSLPFNLTLANPKFDLGLDFFEMSSDINLGVSGFVDVMLGVGIDKSTNGFYLITDFPEAPNTPEFALRQLRLSAGGNASIDVGFLDLSAQLDAAKNFIQANFAVNLNGLGDDKLTLAELADFGRLPAIVDGNAATPELDGVRLDIEAKMDVPLSVASHPDFPSLSTNFILQWGPFGLNDVRTGSSAFTTPLVKLEDLTLNAGEFLSKQALPFFQNIQQYNVLAPLIDKLDDPLPIIGGTLFDLLVTNNPALSQQQKDVAGFLFNVGKTINDFTNGINDGGDDLKINFGDIVINRDQSITPSGGASAGVGVTPSAAAGPYPGQSLPFVGGLIEDLGDIGIVFPLLEVGNLIQLFMGNDVDLIFANLPQLNAGKVFEEEIPIYSIGIPYIASASINAVFGGSINLEVNLSAGLDSSGISKGLSHILEGFYIGDFDPGSDGVIKAGDAERPEVLLEAYVTAGINAKAELLGFDLLKITGKAKFGGNVGLDLNDDNDNIQPPLDPRELAARTDGRFYIDEISTVINSAGGDVFCMFDIVGEIFAELGFEISVPLAPNPDWSHRWTIVKFDIECEPDPIIPDFADIVDDGAGGKMLRFTSTTGDTHVPYHSFAASNHADGDPIEVFLIDKNGDAADGNETLRIRKHGFTEDFGPGETGNSVIADITTLTLITDQGTGSGKFRLTNFGAGPDSVLIDAAIKTRVRLSGGTENDTLYAGDGGGTLLGGAGDDYLSLAEAPAGLSETDRLKRNARLEGGAGNDQAFGGVGNDTVLGGEGNDTVDGGGSGDASDLGRDIVVGGGGDDVVDGRGGGDTLVGDYDQTFDPRIDFPPFFSPNEGSDFIAGGGGGDIIWGDNRGASDSADGPAPDAALSTGDFIFGAAGSDLIFGGGGNDQIETGLAGGIGGVPNRAFGGVGDDRITGGDDRDSLVGNAGSDAIDGAGANDQIYAGDDTFGPNLDSQGFDSLTGGAGDDLLDGSDANAVTATGNAGVDSIIGSRGGDDLAGNEGRDFILAGPGNDSASGGDADDDILGGDGTVGGFTINFTENDGADRIDGDAGNDILIGDNGSIDATTRSASTTESGGAGIDVVNGGTGSDSIFGGGLGDLLDGGSEADLIFGDFGSVDTTQPANVNFTSVDTTATTGGDDLITGGLGDDTAIGGQGGDNIAGGDDNDDLIGGHNVAGGHDGADVIDGGAGYDAIAGDNASIVRRADNQSRNTRALAGATLYNASGAPNVTSNFQVNLDGAVGRDVTLFDHTATTDAALFGDDHLAGGAGHDSVFGQLGNDRIQGDGSTTTNVSATTPSVSATTDGNDYLEGGGGADLMFGNAGQDDLIGGSSNLFGLADGNRPDDADVIYGGSGGDALRNSIGDTTPSGHARDADVILGDNGNIFRIVSSDGAGTYKTFNYDDYAGGLRVIPRAVELLDYSADGNAANDTGGGDRLHGEAGDDSVHGMSGNDFLTGDGQNDHLFGESGDDWISGGTGDDGMLGDDGKILTSRNGKTEPLYGINTVTTQQVIEVKSLQLTQTINVTGLLKHAVDLEPFAVGGNDVMYGGLGNDAMHGGAGQDLMSGAEAVATFYLPAIIPTLTFSNGKFDVWSFTTPLAKIAGHPLNFDAFDGAPANIIRDGNDVLFGDAGNDWLVGGTDTDRLYGGYGDDLLDTDDNKETNGGANSSPDAAPYNGADYAFGGAGRDILLGNAPEDRIIDWVGEFNGYYVPFNPFGQSTVVRQISQQLVTFLYALSRSDGADQTRVGPGLGTAVRNGEPFGELGLVIQQDPDWLDQNGPPIGPQPQ